MSIPKQNVNAWLMIGEDEPSGSSYKTPGSSYQSLIDYNVYRYTDQVNLCFYETVPTSNTTVPKGNGSQYTLQLGSPTQTHPDGSTNQDYMNWIIQDSRAVNPNIKLLVMLAYGNPYISNVLDQNTSGLDPQQKQKKREENARNFANNLVTYLVNYDLDGFDVDWEYSLDSSTPKDDFILFFSTIGEVFKQYNGGPSVKRHLYLTLSPADATNMDGQTVNDNIDWLNLQLYSGFTSPQQFTSIGINQDLLQFGCKFESEGNGNPAPHETAEKAASDFEAGGYTLAINWRVNSGNFQYEQASQIILSQMIKGTGMQFDDSKTMELAGNPPITSMMVRHGDVLNALQPTNTGSFENYPTTYVLPQHGGDSGSVSNFQLNSGEVITEISGYTGTWYGWDCVLQVSFKTNQNNTYGPYGSMAGATSQSPFTLQAPSGESFVAFSGTLVNVPLASGERTDIIASLNATSATVQQTATASAS